MRPFLLLAVFPQPKRLLHQTSACLAGFIPWSERPQASPLPTSLPLRPWSADQSRRSRSTERTESWEELPVLPSPHHPKTLPSFCRGRSPRYCTGLPSWSHQCSQSKQAIALALPHGQRRKWNQVRRESPSTGELRDAPEQGVVLSQSPRGLAVRGDARTKVWRGREGGPVGMREGSSA